MAKQLERECAYVSRDDVVPGYLYDKASRIYYSRNDGLNIKTEEISPFFHMDMWDFRIINNFVKANGAGTSWQKDFIRENAEDAILVRGSKVQERKGIDPPMDKHRHTVTSTYYKSSKDMLLLFSQKLTGLSREELKAYFNSVLAEESQSFIPQEVGKYFMKAYIYQSFTEPGVETKNLKHACGEFCTSLKLSKISTIPTEAVIGSPQPNPPNAMRNSTNVCTESTVTDVSRNGVQNSLESKSSIYSSSTHLDIAETHIPNKCAMGDSSSNSTIKSSEVNGELNVSKPLLLTHDCKKQQLTGSEQDSVARKAIGWTLGTESSNRGIDDLQDGQVGRVKSGKGRGNGTRMGRGKPSADDLLSVGKKSFKSSTENNVDSNTSLYTNQTGSQRTIEFIKNSSHQSFQDNQIDKVQHQSHVSRVQKLCKTFEGSNDHSYRTDPIAKQQQFSNDVEMQDKHQGDSQTLESYSNPALLRDAQTTKIVTTVNITFNSQETNQRTLETSRSKTGSTCNKEHTNIKDNSLETLSNENNEEMQKTNCQVSKYSCKQGKFDVIDELIQQNLREIGNFEKCSSSKGTAPQDAVPQYKADESIQMVPNQETKHIPNQEAPQKVTGLRSHTSKVDETEQGIKQESLIQGKKESDKALSSSALKRSCMNSETLPHNENEPKSKMEKGNNLKKPKTSGKSNQSYSSAVTKNDNLVSGSGNLKAKQRLLNQGLNNDDMLDLKSEKNASHTKQKQRSDKNKDMKTKLLPPVRVSKDPCGVERKYFGIVNESVPEKVLILLGASGSGKTTLLNFIANYFQGNKNADDELIHVEHTSQTLAITAYTFCSSAEDIPITIIDTPGLNDSSGGEVRDHVQALKTFLANAASKNVAVHALGFVAQAHLVRLTSSERLVMDYVSTMFGRNVSEHLITLVTFADNQDTPPVIEAMNNYKVNYKLFLKFNNSALSNGKSDQVDDLDRVYYRVCWRNWKKCLKTLKDSPPLSVNVMKAVQSEVYNANVTEYAERDLKAEMATFFSSYKREKVLSKQNLQVCEQIWSLAAVVLRLKSAQMSSSRTIENIVIEYAKETCKELSISNEGIVHALALAPSKALTVVGTEIIQTLLHAYEIMKNMELKGSSKYLIDMSHCLGGCNKKKEHNVKRIELTWCKSKAIGDEIICFKCDDCKCAGNLHGKQPSQMSHQANEILKLTVSRLRKALQSYSLSGFVVPEPIFLKHLKEHMAFENQDFLDSLARLLVK